MQVVSIISTKGGVGKTTIAANLGAFIADEPAKKGLHVRRRLDRGGGGRSSEQ